MTHNYLILTALEMESRVLSAAFPRPQPPPHITAIGIAAKYLPAQAPRNISAILLAGLAGGLDPALAVGEVILDSLSTGPWPDELPYPRRTILTVTRPVTTPEEKAELFRQTAAAAVDMETDIVRRWAGDIPVLTIRAISDAAGDALPQAALSWVNDLGRPNPLRVAAGVMRRPHSVPALMRLARDSRLAAQRMAEAVSRIVQSS